MMEKMKYLCPTLAIVIPCYNEEEVIDKTVEILDAKLRNLVISNLIKSNSFILFVDDGSTDNTWNNINTLNRKYAEVEGIRLSRNEGHQIAIFAGLEHAVCRADAILTMDADLQQDVNAISLFLDKYMQGYDIVYGIRNNRRTDSFLKKLTSSVYYKLLRVMGCEIYEHSADYRLMSKRAIVSLCKYSENNLFLRGLIPTLGYRTSTVYFDVKEREMGESKYTVKKMLNLALDGITSFTIRPIHLVLTIGVVMTALSVCMIVYAIIVHYFLDTVLGWTSLSISIWFIGGVQLTSIGIIGEYVGKTYIESKHRPRYFIEDSCVHDENDGF